MVAVRDVGVSRAGGRAVSGRCILGALCVGALTACGGGGGGGSGSSPPVTPPAATVPYTKGVYQPFPGLAAQCASPRTGTDPNTQRPYADVKGSVASENNWLRSWIDDTYLWFDEVPDLDPNSYSDTLHYFDLLRTSAVTPSGRYKDQYHFTYPTDTWNALQGGVELGYGAAWVFISAAPPREVRAAYVENGSPAANAGVQRGDMIVSIDGVDAINGGTQSEVNVLNEGLYPSAANRNHEFVLRDLAGGTRTVTLRSAAVAAAPVHNVQVLATQSGPVGYLQFNAHNEPAEAALVDAINTFKAAQDLAGSFDLVLDLRYNGGGLLDLASELAYMIAGPAQTAGQTFELITFNSKHPATDPITGQPLEPMPFYDTAGGYSIAAGTTLPTLNLSRVFVLTGSNTCSASESVINGLRGVNVEVIQIGATTCGKPYGFYPADNCGTTYFAVQLKGVNAVGFGDYADGFMPANGRSDTGAVVTGCTVADDFTQPLGSTQERRLKAALDYRENGGVCPPQSATAMQKPAQGGLVTLPGEGVMHRPPWQENRILRPRRQ